MDISKFNANYKFGIRHLCVTGTGCLAISASQILPPETHMMGALLAVKV